MQREAILINVRGADAIPYTELVPYQGELKRLSIENYERLKAELLEHGFCEPITVWRHEGRWIILNGHQRLSAIKELVEIEGYEIASLPVSIVTIPEKFVPSLVLALTSNFGEMSDESLAKYIKDHALDARVVVQRYRHVETDSENVIRLVTQPVRLPETLPTDDEDEIPEAPTDPRVGPGDMFRLGDHVLLCGDSTKHEHVSRLMGKELADLIFTDPPYNLASDASLAASSIRESYKKLDNSEWDHNFDIRAVFPSFRQVLAENSAVYVCTSNFLFGAITEYLQTIAKTVNYAVWCKSNPMPSLHKRHWTWATELVVYATLGEHTFNFPEQGHALNFWNIAKNAKNDLHPTMKPVAVPEHAILHSSKPGDVVVDFFGGAGSTLVACQKTARRARVIEISPKYCRVILDRWEKLTGREAEKL